LAWQESSTAAAFVVVVVVVDVDEACTKGTKALSEYLRVVRFDESRFADEISDVNSGV
jgi:hypothetical protein